MPRGVFGTVTIVAACRIAESQRGVRGSGPLRTARIPRPFARSPGRKRTDQRSGPAPSAGWHVARLRAFPAPLHQSRAAHALTSDRARHHRRLACCRLHAFPAPLHGPRTANALDLRGRGAIGGWHVVGFTHSLPRCTGPGPQTRVTRQIRTRHHRRLARCRLHAVTALLNGALRATAAGAGWACDHRQGCIRSARRIPCRRRGLRPGTSKRCYPTCAPAVEAARARVAPADGGSRVAFQWYCTTTLILISLTVTQAWLFVSVSSCSGALLVRPTLAQFVKFASAGEW